VPILKPGLKLAMIERPKGGGFGGEIGVRSQPGRVHAVA